MAGKESGLRMEPFLWTLFSAGGVLAAFLIPVHLFLWGLAFPLGWLKAPGYESTMALLANPIVRIYLLLLCSLPLFHWAHRFRYTPYAGLHIKHLNEVIDCCCCGRALLATADAAYLLVRE